jgi:hypothetical protein
MRREVGVRLLASKEMFCSRRLHAASDQAIKHAVFREVKKSGSESDDTPTSSVEIKNCEPLCPLLRTSSGQGKKNILETQFLTELRVKIGVDVDSLFSGM